MRHYHNRPQAILLLLLMLVTGLASCKMEKISPTKESLKDISGNWKIIRATRNGTDLMTLADLTQFRLNFNNGKYTLVNKVPFLVNQDGSYALDDPKYPFQISFTAASGTPVATAFDFPIVNGVRQLTITFSPGCTNNSYVYVFQKVQ
jgi:hypothetical protein